jgi:hypothetical protein
MQFIIFLYREWLTFLVGSSQPWMSFMNKCMKRGTFQELCSEYIVLAFSWFVVFSKLLTHSVSLRVRDTVVTFHHIVVYQ